MSLRDHLRGPRLHRRARLVRALVTLAVGAVLLPVVPGTVQSADAAPATLVGTFLSTPADTEMTYAVGDLIDVRVQGDDLRMVTSGEVQLLEGYPVSTVVARTTRYSGSGARLVLPALAVGEHQVRLRYTGNATYAPSSSDFFRFVVHPDQSTVSATVPSGGVGAGGLVPIRVESVESKARPSGQAQLVDADSGAVVGSGTVTDGTGYALLDDGLVVGQSYDLIPRFSGSATHLESEGDPVPVSVTPYPAGIIGTRALISADSVLTFLGRPIRVFAQALPDQGATVMSGTMALYDGPDQVAVTPVGPGGHADFTYAIDTVRSANLSVRFTSDTATYGSASSLPQKVTAQLVKTYVSALHPTAPVARGGLLDVEARVPEDFSPLQANGPVALTENGVTVGTGSVTNGLGTVRLANGLAVGPHAVALTFPATATHAQDTKSWTLTVDKVPTAVELTPPTAPVTASSRIGVKVKRTADTTYPTLVSRVNVFEDQAALGNATLTDGSGSFPLTGLEPGPHTLTFVYGGDDSTEMSSEDVTIVVTEPAEKSASEVRVTVPDREVEASESLPVQVAVAAGAPVPTGKVFVTEGVMSRGDLTLVDGAGGFPLTGLAPGSHTLKFAYEGDAATEASDATVTFTVRQPGQGDPGVATTTTGLSLDRETVTVGGQVTATATVAVAGGAAPNGQVAFVVDGAVASTQAVGAAGTVSVTLPAGAAGTRTLVARYLGSATQSASASAARNLTVTAASAGPTGPGGPTTPTDPTGPKGPVAPAVSTIAAKAKATKARTIQVVTTVRSTVAVAGQVKVFQLVKKGKKTQLKVVGTGKVAKAGLTVKVTIVTKRLAVGVQSLTVKYLGSAAVAASSRTVKVRVR